MLPRDADGSDAGPPLEDARGDSTTGPRRDASQDAAVDRTTAIGSAADSAADALEASADAGEGRGDGSRPVVVTAIAAGYNFTCGLLSDGRVVCWG